MLISIGKWYDLVFIKKYVTFAHLMKEIKLLNGNK
jgi:hypothetical protein